MGVEAEENLENFPCSGVLDSVLQRDSPALLNCLELVQVRGVDAHRTLVILVLLPLLCQTHVLL